MGISELKNGRVDVDVAYGEVRLTTSRGMQEQVLAELNRTFFSLYENEKRKCIGRSKAASQNIVKSFIKKWNQKRAKTQKRAVVGTALSLQPCKFIACPFRSRSMSKLNASYSSSAIKSNPDIFFHLTILQIKSWLSTESPSLTPSEPTLPE